RGVDGGRGRVARKGVERERLVARRRDERIVRAGPGVEVAEQAERTVARRAERADPVGEAVRERGEPGERDVGGGDDAPAAGEEDGLLPGERLREVLRAEAVDDRVVVLPQRREFDGGK